MSNSSTYVPSAAQIALREAANALAIGTRVVGDPLTVDDCRHLAADLADTLTKLATLVHAAGLAAIPVCSEAHALQAVAHQVSTSATIAQRTAGTEEYLGSVVLDGAARLATATD